jgi:predicted ATPase
MSTKRRISTPYLGISTFGSPLRISFYVLALDFSIDDKGDPMIISTMLRDSINDSVEDFSQNYNLSIKINKRNPFASLISLMGAVKRSKNRRLLVLIDEYDRFANNLICL